MCVARHSSFVGQYVARCCAESIHLVCLDLSIAVGRIGVRSILNNDLAGRGGAEVGLVLRRDSRDDRGTRQN